MPSFVARPVHGPAQVCGTLQGTTIPLGLIVLVGSPSPP